MKLAIFGLALACRRGYCRGGSCVFLANWYACCQHHHDRICMVRRDHNGVKIFMKSNHILYATIIQQSFVCPESKLKWLIGKNKVLFVVHKFQNFDSLQTCIKSAESADRKIRSSLKLENHFDYIFPLFFLLIH